MNFIKILLAILLLLCLLKLPYGFYQFVRLAAFIGFGYFAYEANKIKDEKVMFMFIALAILFQPFYKITLGRTLWNIVDIIVAGYLLLSILNFNNKHEK